MAQIAGRLCLEWRTLRKLASFRDPCSRGPRVNPGLCGDCVHARVIESRRGSRFYLCGLSSVDPAFPKYPRLPVLRCRGYRREEPVSDGTARDC